MEKRGRMERALKNSKRGQMTLFIIIAIVIVLFAVLMFMFYPSIKKSFTEPKNPQALISDCLKEDVEKVVENVSVHGGEVNPEFTYKYNGTEIRYLCYTNDYYQPCVVQEPMLKENVEREIKNKISAEVDKCFTRLEENYKNKGYEVSLDRDSFDVKLLPKRVQVSLDYPMSLTKPDKGSRNIGSFDISLNNNLYELTSIASNIIKWEAKYGDSETTAYMNNYHDLKVQKKIQPQGTTVYVLTNRDTRNKFQFASRSMPWPAGYANTPGIR